MRNKVLLLCSVIATLSFFEATLIADDSNQQNHAFANSKQNGHHREEVVRQSDHNQQLGQLRNTQEGSVATETRIVGGDESTLGQFPYFVELKNFGCGGSLIAPRVVLTAAHCDANNNGELANRLIGATAIVGSYETNVGNNAGTNGWDSVTVLVVDEVMHPNFDSNTEDNDLLLLLLAAPIEINEPTLTISMENGYGIPEEGMGLTVLGLGRRDPEVTQKPDFVHNVVVPVINPDTCNTLYVTNGGNPNFDGNIMFCAGDPINGGIDACQGDSGGPIVDASSNREHIQYGVTSWGIGCATPEFPGIYAKIDLEWIQSVVCSQDGWSVGADFCDDDYTTSAPTKSPSRACATNEVLVDWRFQTDDFA